MSKPTKRRAVTIGLLFALFIGALDVTVVSTAMPHITEELSGLSLVSWVFSIYTLTTCVVTPIFGKLTDLFGRKLVFAIGIILFVLGSVLCGLAESMTALIWFRALQGIGAGALNPVSFTIIGDLFTGEQRGRMQGLFASVWSIAGLVGPLVGGYFVDYLSWRWIFFMNIPVGIVSLLLVIPFLHERFERKAKSIDYTGALLFTVGISALLYALLNGGEVYAWSSTIILSLFAVAVVALSLFLWAETKVKEPMLPLAIFKSRIMNVSNLSGFLAFSISTGISIYAPMWIQSVQGYGATESGLMVLPMALAWPLATNLAGRYMFRIGSRTIVTFGSFLVLASTVWLIAIQLNSPIWYFSAVLTILGFGMGCISTPTTVMVQSIVGWEMRGVATSTSSLMRSLGQTVGVAVFGTLFNSYIVGNPTRELMAGGMHIVFIAMVVIAVLNVLAVLNLPSNRQILKQQTN